MRVCRSTDPERRILLHITGRCRLRLLGSRRYRRVAAQGRWTVQRVTPRRVRSFRRTASHQTAALWSARKDLLILFIVCERIDYLLIIKDNQDPDQESFIDHFIESLAPW